MKPYHVFQVMCSSGKDGHQPPGLRWAERGWQVKGDDLAPLLSTRETHLHDGPVLGPLLRERHGITGESQGDLINVK